MQTTLFYENCTVKPTVLTSEMNQEVAKRACAAVPSAFVQRRRSVLGVSNHDDKLPVGVEHVYGALRWLPANTCQSPH